MIEFELPLTDDYTFADWLTSTRRLQEVAYGHRYELFTDEERADSLMMNLLAITDETMEMAAECGWKPWATPRGWINREAVIREAVDLMHFVGNMLTHAQCTGVELTAAYKAKQRKNLQRQLEGYDGRSGKCPSCHRDLTEEGAVRGARTFDQNGETREKFCTGCGYCLSSEWLSAEEARAR